VQEQFSRVKSSAERGYVHKLVGLHPSSTPPANE
jgi:hypothetical protein